jgi:uncharacterized protein YbgA (DUF1722 family)/uncharacterized protein YbbK (DUF523 family)
MTAGQRARAAVPESAEEPIRIGVSSCLLGREVRFDGGHKRDAFLTDTLGRFVEWVPVCPEVELGLGVPRKTLHLERDAGELRLVENGTDRDLTASMRRFAARRARELAEPALDGYVLKSRSPSCGMERVKVRDAKGAPAPGGRGIFAAGLIEAWPWLPVEDEGRLCDPVLRENWVERVFAHRRLRALFAGRWTPGAVVAFHTAHKLQLLAHSPAAYRALGRLVAGVRAAPRAEFREGYGRAFMEALGVRASRGRNANVLQHMAGYLRDGLDAADRAELSTAIHDYRGGLLPLVVPITLLRHHVRRLGVAYLAGQVYLEPHPKELMLRNHV